MALERVKGTAGSGGRLGHSNMSHFSRTAVVKTAARKRRRFDSKAEIDDQNSDLAESTGKSEDRPRG